MKTLLNLTLCSTLLFATAAMSFAAQANAPAKTDAPAASKATGKHAKKGGAHKKGHKTPATNTMPEKK